MSATKPWVCPVCRRLRAPGSTTTARPLTGKCLGCGGALYDSTGKLIPMVPRE
jgi:hypothetical protein